jgi:hypothetical protein
VLVNTTHANQQFFIEVALTGGRRHLNGDADNNGPFKMTVIRPQ